MVAKQVKETSGLITVTSSLYMQPMKEDKDSEFYCTVEYSMPGNKIETMDSNRIKINLNCEWWAQAVWEGIQSEVFPFPLVVGRNCIYFMNFGDILIYSS